MRFPASAPRLLQIQSVRLTSADVGFFHPHTVIYSRAPFCSHIRSPALSSSRRAWLTSTSIRTRFEDLSNDAECLEDPPLNFAVFPVYLVKAHDAHMDEFARVVNVSDAMTRVHSAIPRLHKEVREAELCTCASYAGARISLKQPQSCPIVNAFPAPVIFPLMR